MAHFVLYLLVMAYLARQDTFHDGATFHITWKCHNHSWFLKDDGAKQLYYNLLLKYKEKYGITIYSYSFMSNHPHLTGHALTRDGLSAFMRTVNFQFAKYINKIKKRRGQVVMDRFKSPVIQSDDELIHVMIYGDLNQVRARMVAHPREYLWNSYHFYAHGKPDSLITPPTSYLALGTTDEERQTAYRKMVDAIIEDERIEQRNYSKTYYIGDPDWVKARYDELQSLREAKRQVFLVRQRRLIYRQMAP